MFKVFTMLCYLMIFGFTMTAGTLLGMTQWDDGSSHMISGDLVIEGVLRLDQKALDNVATLLVLEGNGRITGDIETYGRSSVKISGGKIEKNIRLHGEAALWISSGEIGHNLIAQKDVALLV
jgi:hypothetical protein